MINQVVLKEEQVTNRNILAQLNHEKNQAEPLKNERRNDEHFRRSSFC
jgi:hypothetical protein